MALKMTRRYQIYASAAVKQAFAIAPSTNYKEVYDNYEDILSTKRTFSLK